MLRSLFEQDALFWFSAIAGSGLFAIQFLMSLFGVGEADDSGDGGALDAAKFKWLSKQALTGFLMMFGWSALACKREFELPLPWTLCLACGAGLAAIVASGYLFKGARRLHSPGTIFNLDKSIGKEAIVYQRIPKQGAGKVTVSIDSVVHEIDAIALHGEELESFSSVYIAKKIDEKTLGVYGITHKGTP